MVQASADKPVAAGRVRLKSVALPVEHGGWGFLLEPILLGLLIAPTFSGVCLGVAAAGIFLTNHPFQLALKDRVKGKRYARTPWAERFSAGYAAIAAVGFGLALLTATAPFLLPILIAAPFAAYHAASGLKNRGRELGPELCGAVALSAAAPAIALVGGSSQGTALALWAVLIARALVSILYVRARLRLERDEPVNLSPALLTHVAVLLLAVGASAAGYAPWAVPAAMAILLGRAALGLSSLRRPRRAPIIGIQELGYGLLTVILVALGYRS